MKRLEAGYSCFLVSLVGYQGSGGVGVYVGISPRASNLLLASSYALVVILVSGLKYNPTAANKHPPYIPIYHGNSHPSRSRFSPGASGYINQDKENEKKRKDTGSPKRLPPGSLKG